MGKNSVLIIDDIFPSPLSTFRYVEFTEILSEIGDSYVVTNGAALPLVNSPASIEKVVDQYYSTYPDFRDRVIIGTARDLLNRMEFSLAYAVFLNNIYDNIEILEEKQIPFVFTLYPGGGFALDAEASDQKLKRVLQSPCFRKVIVNEELTRDYLLKKKWCYNSEIICIHGVVISQCDIQNANVCERLQQDSFTLSFCAYKYSPMGKDKGYDIFIDVAKKLYQHRISCKINVIGNFSEEDVDVSELKDCITFHGVVSSDKMKEVFSETDIFLSPTREGVLGSGSFNGFPTTACVIAGLYGALVMCTDILDQNRSFVSGQNIEIISPDAESIFEKVLFYYHHREQLNLIRRRQMKKFSAEYDKATQMAPRIKTLCDEIEWSKSHPLEDTTYPRPKRFEIPIMHCFDNNYVIPAAASFHSMLKYASKDFDYRLFVLHSDITYQNQEMLTHIVSQFPNASLEFINMENRFEDVWEKVRFSGYYTKELLYKLLIASIFPQYDKIIVTDVDVVFRGDISASYFSYDANDPVCFAGVHHICPKGSFLDSYYEGYKENFDENALSQLKICGGYLVANLKYMRENKKEDLFITYLSENAYRLRQPEQDVINFCCSESEVRYLPLANVACTYMYDIFTDPELACADPFFSAEEIFEAMEHPIQIHYATGTKPWKDLLSTKADLWLQSLIESGVYYEFARKTAGARLQSPEFVNVSTLGPGWKPNNSPIIVSVLCCCYNHEAFIRKALEGFVSQKVNFKFEVIVADDASTDNTRAIIIEYAEKYPDLFHCILRDKNVGIGNNYYDALQHVNGKYLAICDGDDYWVDNEKLQRQVDYMEAHPDCTVCCASFIRHEYNEDGVIEVPFVVENYIKTQISTKGMYTFKDLLYCRFIASCTTMLRWQYKGRVPAFLRHYPVIDFPLALLHAAGGRIGVMHGYYPSVYNVYQKSLTNSDSGEKLQTLNNCILREVDQYLNYRFTAVITEYLTLTKNIEMKAASAIEDCELGEPKPPLWVVIYEKYVPGPIKAVYRFFKRVLIGIYTNLVPNSIKKIYRKIKLMIKK